MAWLSLSLLFSLLAADSLLAAETRSSESGRPRGVGPEFAKFYKSSTIHFTCISNPSYKIPFSQVNDDYCDCPDGSDEPGTSACSHISPLSPDQPSIDPTLNTSLALPGFYCKNKGHIPSYVPFLSVNDGKCDYTQCCDGSDEWAGMGGIKCEDRCKEIGKEGKKQDAARRKAHTAAMKKRKELESKAYVLTVELENKVKDLKAQVEGLEVKVKGAEKVVKDTEKSEKLKVVKSPGNVGKVGVLAGIAKIRVDELRTNLVTVRSQRDAMLKRVIELEDVLTKLKEERNPNFNDEGVKRAVQSWEDYAARDTDDGWGEAEDRDLDEITKPDGEAESGIKWSDWEGSDEDSDTDIETLYNFSAYLPPTLRLWLDEKLVSLRQLLVENGILAETSSSSTEESTALKTARTNLADAKTSLTNTQNTLKADTEDLEKDYGPDSIFRALKGVCISKDAGEYTYELCFLGQTQQKPKKGGANQNLGHYASLGTEFVDDEMPMGRGDRITMQHSNGGHCWNGPARSTLVVLACAEKDEIWKVSESEKCVYRMEVGTPAVCGIELVDEREAAARRRDEL